MDKRAVHVAQESLRLTLQTHQNDLNQITNYFIRASVTARNKTLDWFAYIVNSNHKRRALRPDPTQLSSDGFLINISYVLDCLCQPFMDSTFSKMSKIETEYLRRDPRVDILPETKLNADQNASDEYYKFKMSGTNNFISEVFFLTLAAHHYGTEASNTMLKTLEKEVKYLQEQMVKLEGERAKIVSLSLF
jgi:ubiquitin conjugation factor E4 B